MLLATVFKGDQKAPFLIPRCVREGATPFPGLLHFTLDTYLILLSVKQGGIKYHFYFYGGACGVMVIVVGNGQGDMSSNPGRE